METSISDLYDLYRAHPRISTDTRHIEPGSIFFALRGATFDGNRFVGEALEKGAVANSSAHTYDVRATLPNDRGTLLPGMVCRVSVVPAEAVEELAIPARAIRQAGDGSRFVWRVQGDSVVRADVRTGRFVDNDVVIEEGLRAGDRIVVDGMQKVGQGSKISLQ